MTTQDLLGVATVAFAVLAALVLAGPKRGGGAGTALALLEAVLSLPGCRSSADPKVVQPTRPPVSVAYAVPTPTPPPFRISYPYVEPTSTPTPAFVGKAIPSRVAKVQRTPTPTPRPTPTIGSDCPPGYHAEPRDFYGEDKPWCVPDVTPEPTPTVEPTAAPPEPDQEPATPFPTVKAVGWLLLLLLVLYLTFRRRRPRGPRGDAK